jgi:hypothetical protein
VAIRLSRQKPAALIAPYAIAVTQTVQTYTDFASRHDALARTEMSSTCCELQRFLASQWRVTYKRQTWTHVFRSTKRSILSLDLSMYSDLACFILQSEADERFAMRFTKALQSLGRSRDALVGSLHQTKPSKRLSFLVSSVDPELASVREDLDVYLQGVDVQFAKLWKSLEGRLRVKGAFEG